MQTNLEFRSSAFPAYPDEEEEINPGRFGKRLAEFIAAGMPSHGLKVSGIHAEDWGWRVDLQNDAFPLWIGCGNSEEFDDGFLCFIEPSKPFVRKWLKRIPTADVVQRVASALGQIVQQDGKARELRWWTEAESQRG